MSESFTGTLLAFDIAADGSFVGRRVWADGVAPDGICLDADGAFRTSTRDNGCVRVAEGAENPRQDSARSRLLRHHARRT